MLVGSGQQGKAWLTLLLTSEIVTSGLVLTRRSKRRLIEPLQGAKLPRHVQSRREAKFATSSRKMAKIRKE